MQESKLFPFSGIAFVALVLTAIVGIGGSTPGSDASASELASFYSDHAVRQGLGTFLLAASVPFLILFGIGLATRLGGALRIWGYVLIAGTILVAGAVLLVAVAHFALVGADDEISPVALQALNALDGNTWMAFNPAFGVMMLGAAGMLLSGRTLRWLGWVALVLGVAAFIPFADFFAMLATLLWIVVMSFAVSRAPSSKRVAFAAGRA